MAKHICPLKDCGRKFISEEFLTAHKALDHIASDFEFKRRGWATPYGFGDWKEPVTYSEACKQMKAVAEKVTNFINITKEEQNNEPSQGLYNPNNPT